MLGSITEAAEGNQNAFKNLQTCHQNMYQDVDKNVTHFACTLKFLCYRWVLFEGLTTRGQHFTDYLSSLITWVVSAQMVALQMKPLGDVLKITTKEQKQA